MTHLNGVIFFVVGTIWVLKSLVFHGSTLDHFKNNYKVLELFSNEHFLELLITFRKKKKEEILN